MKKISLSIKERAMFCDMLPRSGNKLQQMIVRELLNRFSFTDEEINKYKIRHTDGMILWDSQANSAVFDFELSDVEISVLQANSAIMNEKEGITQHNLSLIEKIDSL